MDGSATTSTIDKETRRAIEDFIVDYAHMIDDDRLEEWPDYFTEKCTYRIINRENFVRQRVVGVMECSSRGMLEDRIKALREANVFEPHWYRHILSGTRIKGRNGDLFQVETSFTVIRTMQEGDMSVFSAGKYVDEIIVEGGKPLFQKRVVVYDSNRIHTLIVIPI